MAVKRFRCLLLCVFLLCESLAAVPDAGAEAVNSGEERIVSLDDLAGADIAVQTGMICDVLAQRRIADVRIQYYNTQTDALLALETGKAKG